MHCVALVFCFSIFFYLYLFYVLRDHKEWENLFAVGFHQNGLECAIVCVFVCVLCYVRMVAISFGWINFMMRSLPWLTNKQQLLLTCSNVSPDTNETILNGIVFLLFLPIHLPFRIHTAPLAAQLNEINYLRACVCDVDVSQLKQTTRFKSKTQMNKTIWLHSKKFSTTIFIGIDYFHPNWLLLLSNVTRFLFCSARANDIDDNGPVNLIMTTENQRLWNYFCIEKKFKLMRPALLDWF